MSDISGVNVSIGHVASVNVLVDIRRRRVARRCIDVIVVVRDAARLNILVDIVVCVCV